MKYNITINGDITRHQFHKRTDIESIILNNTEKIDDYAFLRCYFMKSIILPETLKEIGLGIDFDYIAKILITILGLYLISKEDE